MLYHQRTHIVKQFAGHSQMEHNMCFCGRPIYPGSIWTPIIKVTQNANTQGAMSSEFHLECIERFLDSQEKETPKVRHAGGVCRKKVGKSVHCGLSKTKISKGEVIKFHHRNPQYGVCVKESELRKVLNSEPIPAKCSREAILLDWIIDKERHSYEEVIEKTGLDKKSFDSKHLRLLQDLVKLESVLQKIGKLLTDPIDFRRILNLPTLRWNLMVFLIKLEKPIELSCLIEVLLHKAEESFLRILHSLFPELKMSKTRCKKIESLYKLCSRHNWQFELKLDFNKCYVFNELGSLVCGYNNTSALSSAHREKEIDSLFEFLQTIEDQRKVTQSDIVEGLTSNAEMLRCLCLQLQ